MECFSLWDCFLAPVDQTCDISGLDKMNLFERNTEGRSGTSCPKSTIKCNQLPKSVVGEKQALTNVHVDAILKHSDSDTRCEETGVAV